MKNLTEKGKKLKNYFSKSLISRKIADEEFDTLIDSSMKGLYQNALEKLCLDEADCIKKPVWISGPPDVRKLSGVELEIKKGKDNFLRFIPLGVTVYFFSNHSVLAYQCSFDPTTENPLNESTFEFFYNDIVSFETVTKSNSQIDYDWKSKLLKKLPLIGSFFKTGRLIQFDTQLQFILTTSGGTKLAVALTEDVLTKATEGGKFSLEESIKSVATVRRIIRDKKSYTL